MEKEFFTKKQAEEFYHLLYNEVNSINDTNYNADCLLKFFGLYDRKDEEVADGFEILGSEATFLSIALDFLEISKKYAYSRQSYFNIDSSDLRTTLLTIIDDKEQYEKTMKSIFGSDFENQLRLFELVGTIFYRFIFELGLKIKDDSYFNINFISLISGDIFSQNSPMNDVGMSFYRMFNSNIEDGINTDNMNIIQNSAYKSDSDYDDLAIVEFQEGNCVYKKSDGRILKNEFFSFFNADKGNEYRVDFPTDSNGLIGNITNVGAGIYSIKTINGVLIGDIYGGDEKLLSENVNIFIIQQDNDNISSGDTVYHLRRKNNEVVEDGLYALSNGVVIQVHGGEVTH